MDTKAFKISDVNIMSRIVLTRAEAIAICKKGEHKVRKEFLKRIAAKLMEIDEVGSIVQDDHIPLPSIEVDFSKMSEEAKI